MKFRKILSVISAAAILLSLSACSESNMSSPSNGSSGPALTQQTEQLSATASVDTYFTISSSRDDSVEIPVGVTVPALREGETCPVVLLVHGFLGSKDEEFGFYANNTDNTYDYESIAEQLLTLGIGTIRIDQPGSGDSKDDFLNYTLNNSVSDLQDAYDYCMKNYSFDPTRVGLVGWSMGGKVGPKFVSQNDEIHTMVLLNPAGDNKNTALLTAAAAGLDYENLEAGLTDGKVYAAQASEFAGRDLYLSEDFFKQIDNSTTGDEIISFMKKDNAHGLLIYGDKDSVINPKTYQWLIKHSGMDYLCVTGMDHDLGLESNRPDYTNTVIDTTVSYLYRFLSSDNI